MQTVRRSIDILAARPFRRHSWGSEGIHSVGEWTIPLCLKGGLFLVPLKPAWVESQVCDGTERRPPPKAAAPTRREISLQLALSCKFFVSGRPQLAPTLCSTFGRLDTLP
jgi:hypothetical protein